MANFDSALATIEMFAGNFAPRGWTFCRGQLLAINQNQALFSLLGTTFGGNGTTTFALPDLRGRAPIGTGQGPGLSNIDLGQTSGSEATSITAANLPAHSHTVSGTIKMLTTTVPADALSPGGNYFANDGSTKYNPSSSGGTMKAANISALAIGPAGNGAPVSNRMPYLAINYVICLQGIFPSRN
jgi:microcystin-dependent protein